MSEGIVLFTTVEGVDGRSVCSTSGVLVIPVMGGGSGWVGEYVCRRLSGSRKLRRRI